MKKIIFVRRHRVGLESLRNVVRKMTVPRLIRQATLPKTIPVDSDAIYVNWGNNTLTIDNTVIMNPIPAMLRTSDKIRFRKDAVDYVPKTFFTKSDVIDYLNGIPDENGVVKPNTGVIVRPKYHSQGNDLYLCKTAEEFISVYDNHFRGKDFYATEYIKKDFEYRIFIGSGRVVYVAEKLVDDPTEVAWNHHCGGKFRHVKWTDWHLPMIRSVIDLMTTVGKGLDFGAVDVILTHDNYYVLEVNTAIGLDEGYWSESIAKYFDFVSLNGVGKIDVGSKNKTYLDYIHPCMTDKARVGDSDET